MASNLTRRHFLKSASLAAVSVPLSRVVAHAGLGISKEPVFPQIYTLLLSGKNPPINKRNKLVFISDIHMNVNANYSWMVKHTDYLGRFLNDINRRDDVAELVILGDLVDDWVNPVTDSPQSFSNVLTASNNTKKIVPALQEICANSEIKVTYVVGNHDMLSFEVPNRETLATTFPGMEIVSNSPGLGAYSKDNIIWAEHGHRYCLFNAPDIWSRPDGHLPLGYFISRLAASKAASSGVVTTTPDLLDEYVKKHVALSNGVFDDLLIIAIFNGIALWSGINPLLDRFVMAGKDGYIPDPLVEQVAITYDSIFSDWPSHQNRVSNVEAVWNDVGNLSSAANLLFEMPGYLTDKYPFTPRIVLFGHTHQAAFQYHSGEEDTIYVNTGTWIDNKDMTWVEIEINDIPDGKKSYDVSLWYQGETSPRQSAVITAAVSSPVAL
jgi:UDP-2,3-diacylglucosamine pyrophosphatase LpxH